MILYTKAQVVGLAGRGTSGTIGPGITAKIKYGIATPLAPSTKGCLFGTAFCFFQNPFGVTN